MNNVVKKVVTNPSFYGCVYGTLAGAVSGYMIWWRNKPINELGNMVQRGACMGAIIGSATACVVDLTVYRNKFNVD